MTTISPQALELFPSPTSNRDEVPHLLLTLGAGVTPAQGSVKPEAGFTFNSG